MRPPRMRLGGWVDERWRHRAAQRTRAADLRGLIADQLERPPLPAPFTDLSDCRHGCNGDCIVMGMASDVCDFTCHPGLVLDEARAARFETALRKVCEAR